MIKYLILFLLLSLRINTVYAETPEVSQIPTAAEKNLLDKLKQIEILKEKIATKVAQVRDSEKGALTGQIKSIQENVITLISTTGEKKFSYSEDTVIYKLEINLKKEAKVSDLKAGQIISSFGNFNENKEQLLSKFIYIQDNLIRINGLIADLDKTAYTITVKAKEGNKLLDFEKYTKTSLYDPVKGIQKSGFSKYKIGDTVFVMATPNTKEENRFFAQRIIQVPVADSAISPVDEKTVTPTPTKS